MREERSKMKIDDKKLKPCPFYGEQMAEPQESEDKE